MNNQYYEDPGSGEYMEADHGYMEMMKIFEELSFAERMSRMFSGLGQPKDSGEYKFAKLQLQRLSAPMVATLLPMILVALLMVFGGQGQLPERAIVTEVIDAEDVKDLEEPPPPPDPDQTFDPTDITIPHDVPVTAISDVVSNEPMSPQPAAFNAVTTIKSPITMRGIYGDRVGGARGQAIRRGGGSNAGEAAVMRALRWLKKTQNADGSWPKNKVAMTSLAVLCYLAHGERPDESEEFGSTVRAGIEYVMSRQDANGMWRGGYEHPIATYALCEAYGLTMNPSVKEAAAKGIMGVISRQNVSGGWDYFNKPPQTDRDDTSVMGWAAQALKAAMISEVIDDKELLEKTSKQSVKGFLLNANTTRGGFGYTGPGYGGLSGVGALGMQFHNAGNHAQVRRTLELMDGWVNTWENPKVPGGSPQYYFYYATQAMFQSGYETKRWKAWNAVMLPEYIKAQKVLTKEQSGYVDHRNQPQEIGWWENNDYSGADQRPTMDTTLAALQLMVYYRYLPTFKSVEIDAEVLEAAGEGEVQVNIQL